MHPGDDILKYFSELTDSQQRQEIEKSIEGNAPAMEDFAMLNTIWEEAGALSDFAPVDVDQAWHKVEEIIDPDVATRRFVLWPYISVAASIALFVMSGLYFLNKDTSDYLVAVTGPDEVREITLSDGSTVILRENSELRYPKQFVDTLDRRVALRGDAIMAIATDTSWPFYADNYGAAVEAMGTEFVIISDSTDAGQRSVLENAGGQMAMFEKEDPANRAELLNVGDRAIFTGGPIEKILAYTPPPPDTLSQPVTGGSFVDEMQSRFERVFVTTPETQYIPGQVYMVNFDQDILSIMAQLDTIANLDWRLDPDGAVVLLRLMPKDDN